MDWQARYHPLDLFPTLNARIEALISAGDCEAVSLVREEINSVGTPDLKTWASAHAAIFVPLEPAVQLEAASIEARYPARATSGAMRHCDDRAGPQRHTYRA